MRTFPRQGSFPYVLRSDRLRIPKFLTDSGCARVQVITPVERLLQVCRERGGRNRHHLTAPSGGVANLLDPLSLGERSAVTDIVGAAGRAIIGDSKRDRRSHILDVASRPAPASLLLAQQNGRTAVGHSPDVRPEAIAFVARSIDSRQSQHRRRNVQLRQDYLLD